MNQHVDAVDAGDGVGPRPTSGILRISITEAELTEFDWQQELQGIDAPSARWSYVFRFNERAKELEGESPSKSAVLRLLAAVISMQLLVNTSTPFTAALKTSTGRSAAPEDLDERDLSALALMARQAHSPWLRARLADVGLIVARSCGVKSWQLGGLASRAYLLHAVSNGDEHPVERRESLQRAMELGWQYLREDKAFHIELWNAAMSLLREALDKGQPGVSFPIAREIARRNTGLASEVAELFEQQAELLFAESPSQLAADIFRESSQLWHAAKNEGRCRSARLRGSDVLVALARTPAHATLRAHWMNEGIAILRRTHGERERIKELQGELAEIRTHIIGEMATFSHEIDASDIVAHVKERITADNLPEALLQVAFAFSAWADAGQVRARVIESAGKFLFSSMFSQVTYDENGVPVAVALPFDASNGEELEKRVVQDLAQFEHSLLARVAIPCALDILQARFEPTMADLISLLNQSPVVPRGHEWSLARGLLAGLNHDWEEAAVFLIPQVEPFVRAGFKRHGVNTLAILSDGVEEEKSLNLLLEHPDVSSVLAPDIVLELKALLTHKSGHNLRNRYGHGLIRDEELSSVGTIVLWWTMLRLVLWPYRAYALEKVDQGGAAL